MHPDWETNTAERNAAEWGIEEAREHRAATRVHIITEDGVAEITGSAAGQPEIAWLTFTKEDR